MIGVAAAALFNGSKLETVFNPDKFEKFDNKYSSEEYDYVAGDGEETNIAGNSKKDKEKYGGDDLQALQLKKRNPAVSKILTVLELQIMYSIMKIQIHRQMKKQHQTVWRSPSFQKRRHLRNRSSSLHNRKEIIRVSVIL